MTDSYTKRTVRIILSLPFPLKAVICLSFIGVFGAFRFNSWQDKIHTTKSVEGILRSEYKAANTYALSKAISDLESLNILKCVTLIELNHSNRIFYDTSGDKGCQKNQRPGSWLQSTVSTEFTAINGYTYQLNFETPSSPALLSLEILIYTFLIFSIGLYARFLDREQMAADLKIKVLALEKELAFDNAKRIKHDVAAPLTALKSVISSIESIDPDLKNLIRMAVERTEYIFNQLNHSLSKSPSAIGKISLNKCLKEIINEKRSQWGADCDLEFVEKLEVFALGEERELKRILSNLIDNSYESYSGLSRTPLITAELFLSSKDNMATLKIIDNGCGIPANVLRDLGRKGFSFGKEDSKTSGEGLGVHHAITTIQSWGGTLEYTSESGQLTEATINLIQA